MADTEKILFFLKAPEPDRVKSRIAAVLGNNDALELYRRFVLDELDTIERAGVPYRICVHPPDAIPELAAWLGNSRSYHPQHGGDLGERMEQAFRAIFAEGVQRAVLIGSDLPDLPAELLRNALNAMQHADAVIGPARDGGYYLIGFRRSGFVPDIFHGITWSGPDVFDRTMQSLELNDTSVHLLPVWHDVDTVKDLCHLVLQGRDAAFASSRTFRYLETIRDRLPVTEEPHGPV